MMPVGYMAKHVAKKPDWLKAPQVIDVYSVSGCVSEDFADYINYWKHNGYWLFDSPEVIRHISEANSVPLRGTSLFYYEAYEVEFGGKRWNRYQPTPEVATDVVLPSAKRLEGFDVVTFPGATSPACSPLSCNGLAAIVPTNQHCLFSSFADAKQSLENGAFTQKAEPGPYRIFSVYSVDWMLAEGLDAEVRSGSGDIENTWREELRRLPETVCTGKASTVPWEEVQRKARTLLDGH